MVTLAMILALLLLALRPFHTTCLLQFLAVKKYDLKHPFIKILFIIVIILQNVMTTNQKSCFIIVEAIQIYFCRLIVDIENFFSVTQPPFVYAWL